MIRSIVCDSTKLSLQLLHHCRHIHHQLFLTALDSHSYAHMLQQIIRNSTDPTGKHLHCHILKCGTSLDLVTQNILLNFYVPSNSLQDASKLFDEMTLLHRHFSSRLLPFPPIPSSPSHNSQVKWK